MLLREVIGTAYLLLPLLGGAVLHGLCLRYGWLGFLARPIDAGRTLGGKPLFGHSKTLRGPLAVAAGSATVWAVQRTLLHRFGAFAEIELVDLASLPGWLGALAGGVAELTELPNSFVKRRLGIAAGATARGPLSVLFYLWDQLDVLLGFWLVVAWFVPATPLRIALSIVIVGGIHPLLTVAGYLLGMRPTPR
ncbi:MAG TPA: CDP-archaeol synthase [Myxococcota bacterium]|nr:CDP-archaeol synthase [Myxococcota bacterium]